MCFPHELFFRGHNSIDAILCHMFPFVFVVSNLLFKNKKIERLLPWYLPTFLMSGTLPVLVICRGNCFAHFLIFNPSHFHASHRTKHTF